MAFLKGTRGTKLRGGGSKSSLLTAFIESEWARAHNDEPEGGGGVLQWGETGVGHTFFGSKRKIEKSGFRTRLLNTKSEASGPVGCG